MARSAPNVQMIQPQYVKVEVNDIEPPYIVYAD